MKPFKFTLSNKFVENNHWFKARIGKDIQINRSGNYNFYGLADNLVLSKLISIIENDFKVDKLSTLEKLDGFEMLCDSCSNLLFIDKSGNCKFCGADTPSVKIILCNECSLNKNQCGNCELNLSDMI